MHHLDHELRHGTTSDSGVKLKVGPPIHSTSAEGYRAASGQRNLGLEGSPGNGPFAQDAGRLGRAVNDSGRDA